MTGRPFWGWEDWEVEASSCCEFNSPVLSPPPLLSNCRAPQLPPAPQKTFSLALTACLLLFPSFFFSFWRGYSNAPRTLAGRRSSTTGRRITAKTSNLVQRAAARATSSSSPRRWAPPMDPLSHQSPAPLGRWVQKLVILKKGKTQQKEETLVLASHLIQVFG